MPIWTNYLVTDDSDSVLNYYKKRDLLVDQARSMYDETLGIHNEDALIYKDIYHMGRELYRGNRRSGEG